MIEKRKKYVSRDEALLKLQRFCAYQDRCHQEVRSKLLDLGIYGDDLEAIMAELIADTFLDEERFARSFARGRFRTKQWGRVRIRQELKRRDITDYCIRKAMEEIGEEDYLLTLEAVIHKKNGLLRTGDPFDRRRRLADHAVRRGFEPELVWEKVKAIVRE